MDRKRSDAHASLAGLSEHGTTSEPTRAHPFETADDQRYRELSVVGAGGLGTVLRAHDQRLDRDVALKRIGPGVDEHEAATRFAREARITARLDHPGIVPIHDAGRTSDGRLFYTMRLIHGRSLAELAREATSSATRLALVPALAAACHAIGFAHRQHVVHRDLKPANLMIGELGETQVVDWGLAADLAESGHAVDDQAGTPAYLSPEAARGMGGTIAADIWALGAVLYELITGARRVEGTRDEVLAVLRRGELAAERWPDDTPVELRAIAHKALALDPGARYSDAEAMAVDLEAFRDGRRVAAHAYTMRELSRRLIIAWRWPLAVVAAIAIATIVVLGFTTYRTEQQRVRAVTAEQHTARELARAEVSLGWALSSSAVVALEADRHGRAELLAAHALTHGPNPDARGVLAATLAGVHPTSSTRTELPGCSNVVPAGSDLALCAAPDHIELWELPSRRLRWRREISFAGALAVGDTTVVGWTDSGEIEELELATGAARVRHRKQLAGVTRVARDPAGQRIGIHDRHSVVILEPGQPPLQIRPCGDIHRIDAIALGGRDLWANCTSGELVRTGPGGPPQIVRRTPFGGELPAATAISLSEPETDLVIGGAGGDVLFIDLRGCMSPDCDIMDHQLVRGAGRGAIRSIHSLGRAAIAVADGGDAIYLQLGIIAPLMALPVGDLGVVELGEAELRIGGAQLRRWNLPLDYQPRRIAGLAGLARGAIAPNGTWIATATDSTVYVWTLPNGHLHDMVAVDGTIGSLEPSADSKYLAVSASSGPAVHVYGVHPWKKIELEGVPAKATYAGFARDGAPIALDERTPHVWTSPAAAPRKIEGSSITAVAVGAPGTRWLLDTSREVWRWADAPPARAHTGAGAVAIAASRDGRRLATAGPSRAEIRDLATGEVRMVEVRDAEILALALSADARWLAAATTTGRIVLWDATNGTLIAHLRGHKQRATWVEFHDAALWSVGWDGAALRWDLAALERAPAELARAAEAAWGLTLDDVLATQP